MSDDVRRLADVIQGTCKSIFECCQILELDEGVDWEDKLLDVNIEICVVCNWWHESSELEFVESYNGGLCDQCLSDEGIEID